MPEEVIIIVNGVPFIHNTSNVQKQIKIELWLDLFEIASDIEKYFRKPGGIRWVV